MRKLPNGNSKPKLENKTPKEKLILTIEKKKEKEKGLDGSRGREMR